jgi:hypothetical protein
MPNSEIARELDALRQELTDDSTSSPKDRATPNAKPEEDTAIAQILETLQQLFDETAQEAEQVVAEHPVVTLAAAFTVGFFIGRFSGTIK